MSPQELRHLPLFNPFADDDLQQLGRQGEPVNLQTGDILFAEGDPAQGLFVVVEGQLEIFKQVCGEVTLANVPRGSFVGEISLLTGLPHNASARASVPTRLLKYGASVFEGMKNSPIAAYSGDDRAAIERRRNAGAAASTALGAGHYGGGAGARIEQSGFGKSAGGDAASTNADGLANADAQALRGKAQRRAVGVFGRLQTDLIGRAANADLDPLAKRSGRHAHELARRCPNRR